ncbi:hypothetical protein D3C75_1222300 [compost metagenome]
MAAQGREQRDHGQQRASQAQVGPEAIEIATRFADGRCGFHEKSLGAASLSNASRFW